MFFNKRPVSWYFTACLCALFKKNNNNTVYTKLHDVLSLALSIKFNSLLPQTSPCHFFSFSFSPSHRLSEQVHSDRVTELWNLCSLRHISCPSHPNAHRAPHTHTLCCFCPIFQPILFSVSPLACFSHCLRKDWGNNVRSLLILLCG